VKTAIGTIAKTQRTSLLNAVRDLIACLPKIVQITLLHQYWRKMSNNPPKFHPNRLLTQEEIEVRVWASVVLIVTIILAGIVIFMLYSLAFVVQPIKSMAPIDQSFAKMLNDIVLLIVGGIGGVMSRKGVQAVADKVSPPPSTPSITTTPATVSSGLPVWVNPPLDEEWRAPPPPTTPPDFLHPEREEIAKERASK
jgi:hypothetical protein